MNVISLVANLQKEKDYYQDAVKECQAVIKQLTEGPGEIEYIHPFDVYEMLNNTKPGSIVDIYKMGARDDNTFEVASNGKKYKQSVWIPAKNKNIK